MVENDFRSTYRGWNPHFPLYVSCSTSSLLRSAYQYLRTRLKIKSVEIRFQLWNYSLVVQNRKISVTFTYCLVFTYSTSKFVVFWHNLTKHQWFPSKHFNSRDLTFSTFEMKYFGLYRSRMKLEPLPYLGIAQILIETNKIVIINDHEPRLHVY